MNDELILLTPATSAGWDIEHTHPNIPAYSDHAVADVPEALREMARAAFATDITE